MNQSPISLVTTKTIRVTMDRQSLMRFVSRSSAAVIVMSGWPRVVDQSAQDWRGTGVVVVFMAEVEIQNDGTFEAMYDPIKDHTMLGSIWIRGLKMEAHGIVAKCSSERQVGLGRRLLKILARVFVLNMLRHSSVISERSLDLSRLATCKATSLRREEGDGNNVTSMERPV